MTPEEKKELVIDSGTQDQFRNDLICIKYTQIEGVENAEIVVVKGEPGREAVDPAYEVGNIETGKSVHHMPLYRIKLEGLNITGIEPMYKIYHRIPNFGYGTGEPSGGEDGDVYFKIIE